MITTQRRHDHAGQIWHMTIAGTGMDHACLAAQRLVDTGATALLSWGVAGALDGSLHTGDLVIPTQVAADDACMTTHGPWLEWISARLADGGIPAMSGTLWTSRTPIVATAAKRQLGRNHSATIVDMEAAAVGKVANEAGIPFAVVKAVCDPLDQPFPDVLSRVVGPDGSPSRRGVCQSVLQGPPAWRALAHLRRDYHTACQSLTRAANVLLAP